MKKLIIAIIGESGSGKTTAQNIMYEQFGIIPVQSCTTRPRRFPEENCHLFLNDEAFDRLPNPIATTKYGEYRYAGLMPESDICSYVIDEAGLKILQEDPRFEVVSVLILAPKNMLIERVGEERVKRCKSVVDLKDFDYIYSNGSSMDELKGNTYRITESILKDYNK
jgi:guanylate kinase